VTSIGEPVVVTAPIPPPPKRIQLHFDVATDDQAAELSAAWEEIVSGKRTRISNAAEDVNEIMERARTSLQTIVRAIEEHPGTGQRRRLVREAKAFGGLLATQPSPDGDRPLVHARLLSESTAEPLCVASDGPWRPRTFDFQRTTCHECQSLVLDSENLPA
jgi:hypothetical protein